MSFLTFLLGCGVGAMFSPYIKPFVLKVIGKFKDWINRQPDDPFP